MIISPNCVAWRTSNAAARTVASRSSGVSARFSSRRRSVSRRTQFSTMITEPSTISPKSIAPRLIRFPEMPYFCIPVSAKSIESGIAEATISAARMFPNSANRTATTSTAPSKRFFSTVRIVFFTSSVRS